MLVYGFNQLYLGLPHSDISGSMLAANSPERFVGHHVLLRLCVPRYPPSALDSLTFIQKTFGGFYLLFVSCDFSFSLCSFLGSYWLMSPAVSMVFVYH
jgi:hypothetical protein